MANNLQNASRNLMNPTSLFQPPQRGPNFVYWYLCINTLILIYFVNLSSQ